MNGRPVWLASVSRRDEKGKVHTTGHWGQGLMRKGEKVLREVLAGVGDDSMERLFRMNVTLCLHRAMTDREIADLPAWWHAAPAVDIAGGPIEGIKHKGYEVRPSVLPCEDYGREKIHPDAPDRLWIPVDCGSCPPCLDRQRAREGKVA